MTKAKAAPSIWLRLIIGLVGVSLLAAVATGLLIYQRFVATSSAFRDRTLQNDAQVIDSGLRNSPQGTSLQLPDFLADGFQQGKGKFAIVGRDGQLLIGSPGVTKALAPIDETSERDFFLSQTDKGTELYGFTLKAPNAAQPAWIQVAIPKGEIAFDSVLEEFIKDIGWIWAPFILGLLVTNLLVLRIGLRPLRHAAAQAESIGPSAVSTRLAEDGLPREVFSLVSSVNRALDRLEIAFHSQQRFIADAAHELRTPTAVLKAHAAILPKSPELAALKEEIDGVERLVNQLLDAARLDVTIVHADETTELNTVAQTVAAQLAPMAISKGKSIEVVPADASVVIGGSQAMLACALRNLIENAIRFTAVGTVVSIEVSQPPALRVNDHGPGVKPEDRDVIFKRFWQGNRDRGGGAGLGLDIVARTVEALGGSVSVEEAPGGGASFLMRFPQPGLSPA